MRVQQALERGQFEAIGSDYEAPGVANPVCPHIRSQMPMRHVTNV